MRRLLGCLALLTSVLPSIAFGQVLSAPANPSFKLGYYGVHEKDGDDTAFVWRYTNFYIAIPGNTIVTGTSNTDWRTPFRASLQLARDNHKPIYLILGGCVQAPSTCLQGLDVNWDTILEIAKDYWGQIEWIEVASEENLSTTAVDQRISTFQQRCSQLSECAGAPPKKLGILLNVGDIMNSSGIFSAGLSFINIEAYFVDSGNTAVNQANLASALNGAKSRVRSAGKLMFITAQAFDRGTWTDVDRLEQLQRPYYQNVSADGDVIGMSLFSYNRPMQGTKAHPQLKHAHREMAAAIRLLHMSGDFDRDAAAELAVWRPSTGQFFWALSSGGHDSGPANTRGLSWGSGALGDVPMLGDMDGDGLADPVVWRPGTGTFFWLDSSNGYSTQLGKAVQFGSQSLGDKPMVADFDGDGRDDLVVWRPADGTWYWLPSSSGFNYAATRSKQWGAFGDVPLLGDIDGDQKPDLVVWRPDSGTWFWLTSSSNYESANAKQWGSAGQGDVPLLGDVNSDGKADLIVWRPGPGAWFSVSAAGPTDYSSQRQRTLGSQAAGDVPLLGDFDGDGVVDLTVWRKTTGEWLWLTSVSDHTVVSPAHQFGSDANGDVPLIRR